MEAERLLGGQLSNVRFNVYPRGGYLYDGLLVNDNYRSVKLLRATT
jgi:hypothetical protein